MTARSKAVVLDYMKTLTTGEFAALREFFTPETTWTLAGDLPVSKTYTGPDGILDEFVPAMVARLDPDSIKLDFHGVIAEGDRVLAEWDNHAMSVSGRRYHQHCLAIFTVRDGRIVAVREYFDTLHAKEALFD
ncbi:limonene-1,2-epoxide hydrolase [Streptomyces albus subsp. albus]|nr:limonene-1,2-epoxide hydrolase [Streptomyces albus subsp. albus]